MTPSNSGHRAIFERAIVKRSADVERNAIPVGTGAEVQVLLGPGDGAPNFAMRRFVMSEAGGGMPMHTNLVEHEQYVLAGRARITVGGEVHEVSAGDVLYIPAEVPHGYEVVDAPFEFLCMVPNQHDEITLVEAGC